MNTVYKILNLKNNKVYIGSSSDVEKRWKQHKQSSKNPKDPKYNYPLYNAFRKYGIENFSFEIIENNFSTREEMENYEKEMIIKYNSLLPNGYNQTLNTNSYSIAKENLDKYMIKISQKCALVDNNNEIIKIYDSYHAAARDQGWDGDKRASSVKKICDGLAHDINGLIFRKIDENNEIIIPEQKTRKRKTAICGISVFDENDIVYYESVSEAARSENASRQSISKCINGNTRYSKVKNRIWKKVGDNNNEW